MPNVSIVLAVWYVCIRSFSFCLSILSRLPSLFSAPRLTPHPVSFLLFPHPSGRCCSLFRFSFLVSRLCSLVALTASPHPVFIPSDTRTLVFSPGSTRSFRFCFSSYVSHSHLILPLSFSPPSTTHPSPPIIILPSPYLTAHYPTSPLECSHPDEAGKKAQRSLVSRYVWPAAICSVSPHLVSSRLVPSSSLSASTLCLLFVSLPSYSFSCSWSCLGTSKPESTMLITQSRRRLSVITSLSTTLPLTVHLIEGYSPVKHYQLHPHRPASFCDA